MRYLFWGLLLILWAVLIFSLQQNWIAADNIWKAFITGLGSIFLIQAIIYYLTPSYRSHITGRLIPGAILLFAGLGLLFDFSAWWPLILVVAGMAIILVSWFLQQEISNDGPPRNTEGERGQIPAYHR
jgi:hypothetical protein